MAAADLLGLRDSTRRRHSTLLAIAEARRHRLPHHAVATGSTRGLAEVHEQQTRTNET